jgi:hypothetical protein
MGIVLIIFCKGSTSAAACLAMSLALWLGILAFLGSGGASSSALESSTASPFRWLLLLGLAAAAVTLAAAAAFAIPIALPEGIPNFNFNLRFLKSAHNSISWPPTLVIRIKISEHHDIAAADIGKTDGVQKCREEQP